MIYSDDYLDFYDVYPRKEGKADGFKAWSSLSDSDKKIAKADVEKRKRLGAYSSNKKLIQLPGSYIRARRWEDDWEATLESSRKPEFESLGAPVARVVETIERPWKERLLGRLFLAWIMSVYAQSKKVDDVRPALKLRDKILRDTADMTEEPREQSIVIAPLYLDWLDAEYGFNIAQTALRRARQQK